MDYRIAPGVYGVRNKRNSKDSLNATFESLCEKSDREFGYGIEAITSEGRTQPLSWIKQIIQYILIVDFRYKLGWVSQRMGVHHTTTVHARNKAMTQLNLKDRNYTDIYNALKNNEPIDNYKVFRGDSKYFTHGKAYRVWSDKLDDKGQVRIVDDEGTPRQVFPTNFL